MPVPLRSVIRLLRDVARAEGPDATRRIAADRSVFEIGPLGAAGLRGPTVRAGLHRVARHMSMHCTHEVFTAQDAPGGVIVRDGWMHLQRDDEALHHAQQYVVGIVDMLCGLGREAEAPLLARVALVPHPDLGLTHLRPWLGDRVQPATSRTLEIEIADAVADARLPPQDDAPDEGRLPPDVPDLRRIQTLSDSVEVLVSSLLPRTAPTLEIAAEAAGLSPRTLRRRLSAEGRTFSGIVDATRIEIAIAHLKADATRPIADLAGELGYAHPAALTRAMKRWTGRSPTGFRRANAAGDGGA